MEYLELFGCDTHRLEIFVTDRPGELVVVGGPGWPHRCVTCNAAWRDARAQGGAPTGAIPATDPAVAAPPAEPSGPATAAAPATGDPAAEDAIILRLDRLDRSVVG